MAERKEIIDEELDKVAGGLIDFNANSNVCTYLSPETGAVTTYQLFDAERGFALSNQWHTAGYTEDQIIAGLKKRGIIG